jgi:hypothetical protein
MPRPRGITPQRRCGRLEALLGQPRALAEPKSDPGALGPDTLLTDIGKLITTRSLGLNEAVFAKASDRIVTAMRAGWTSMAMRPRASFSAG